MTTIFQKSSTCAVCGAAGTYDIVGSTNRLGVSDLDTRPPEMERSTLEHWVQECPSCGYCAPDVAQPIAAAETSVRSEEYQRQRGDAIYPALANRFLCRARILEAAGELREAFWAAIFAAWTCDDTGTPQAAATCRERAIALCAAWRAQGRTVHDQAGADEALLADVLRRCGKFAEVEPLCRAGLAKNPEPLVAKVLEFQIRLAAAGDAQRHTMGEVEIAAERPKDQ